ncbi:hypothetical protein [Nocardia wallacei]|uniref:hypothetical protein n=1 Tax=Nocardia wallacei TaxID=480035 RepID=UPI0024572522|nr:hypothetical protein [Nocardia wallacei]
MTNVLITGMSGVGKTSLLDELARRGHRTVDTDYGDYHETIAGERLWRADRIDALLSAAPGATGVLLRQAATLEVVTTVPVERVADIVLGQVA